MKSTCTATLQTPQIRSYQRFVCKKQILKSIFSSWEPEAGGAVRIRFGTPASKLLLLYNLTANCPRGQCRAECFSESFSVRKGLFSPERKNPQGIISEDTEMRCLGPCFPQAGEHISTPPQLWMEKGPRAPCIRTNTKSISGSAGWSCLCCCFSSPKRKKKGWTCVPTLAGMKRSRGGCPVSSKASKMSARKWEA